ncbi:universal stress protein [Mariniblastus sp.]|nr:universal stress protein [bacterium]MDA7902053.1 universal stress protein [Mariniblastus sp.]MDA7905664.1 universal stress protein [Mariniblastus sp.]MDA7926101.1 universal stress protein [Mariniblastus sp.]MDB4468467.1 universal stress protein [bacterium]
MNTIRKILVPIDDFKNCQDAVDLACLWAKKNEAKIIFCYVAIPPLPPTAYYVRQEIDELILQEQTEFRKVIPTDSKLEYQHEFLRGNPGPEIVKLASEQNCDLIIMATHNRVGLVRWILGSVSEYVIRHSNCPVLSVKVNAKEPALEGPPESITDGWHKSDSVMSNGLRHRFEKSPFVTSAMSHVVPVHDYDQMSDAMTALTAARATAAPVINRLGSCIGILTEADIKRYLELKQRLADHDESVLDEIFEIDEYGLRRGNQTKFYQVTKHMSAPVVSVPSDTTCFATEQLFAKDPKVQHLIVVDGSNKPIGVVTPAQLNVIRRWNLAENTSAQVSFN